MEVLKDILNILSLEFTHLINECLYASIIMPPDWKMGTVTPIPKGTASLNVGDYGQISVLPGPSKVIERVVYNQVVYHLESNSLLDKRQHGYCKGFSTALAILEVTTYLYENVDLGNYIHCAFIDYSKAFDTLDHDILYIKLKNLGFGVDVVRWCKDFLSGRYQRVKIDSETSSDFQLHVVSPRVLFWALFILLFM